MGIFAFATSVWVIASRGQLADLSRDYRLVLRKIGLPYYTDRADEMMTVLAGVVGMAFGVGFVAIGLFVVGHV
jgi:hypothetical protein